jgi:hypothetical protein
VTFLTLVKRFFEIAIFSLIFDLTTNGLKEILFVLVYYQVFGEEKERSFVFGKPNI